MIIIKEFLLLAAILASIASFKFDDWEDVLMLSDLDEETFLAVNPNVTPVSEINALEDFYNNLHGDYWTWSSEELYGAIWDFSSGSDPCYDNWQGIYCTCHLSNDTMDAPVNYYNIRYFYFDENYASPIYGITAVCHIGRLFLGNYNLTGQIPDSIGDLSYLSRLHLHVNKITGTIPNGILHLTYLQSLDIGRNQLTGPIPPYIGYYLPFINIFSVYTNHLTGPIPASFGSMAYLVGWYVGMNDLTGTLPPEIGDCQIMYYLDASSNNLTGTIPPEISQMNGLQIVTLFRNRLTGTLPSVIVDCPLLSNFYIDDNYVRGYHGLDYFIHNSSTILQYGFTNNLMTGSLPTIRTTTSKLEWIAATNNRLTGTIPDLSKLTDLVMVELTANNLHGTIPNNIGDNTKLKYFYASETSLSGTLPESIGDLSDLIIFNCSLTKLYGTIPQSFTNLHNIMTIELYSNKLTGTIPQGLLTSSPSLSILLLQNNQFSGPMIGEELVPSTNETDGSIVTLTSSVEYLDVSSNRLGGEIYPELFSQSPRLISLALVKNCIYSPLPETICERGDTLKVLAMDGMNTVCRSHYVKQARQFIGSVPPCIFQLPNLVTLHLSGNRITGTLPDVGNISSTLQDVSISHNDLHGSIPYEYQLRSWKNLDLSYNKLTNSLHEDFIVSRDNSSSISLLVNRLSGKVPSTFRNALNINVLQGSLFECDYDQNDLPTNDPVSGRYSCGTNSLNILIYVWIFLLIAALFLIFYWYREDMSKFPIQWKYLTSMTTIFKRLTTFIVVLLLPVYLGCSYHYKNYSHSYAWKVSAVYLSGMVPTILLFALWWGFLGLFYYGCETKLFSMEFRRNLLINYMTKVDPSKSPVVKKGWTWNSVLYSALLYSFILANMVIVVAVNAAYVYVNINYSNTIGNLAEAALAVFKLLWNNYLLPLMLKHILVKPAHKLKDRITSSSFRQFSRLFSSAKSKRFSFAFSRSGSSEGENSDGKLELTSYQKLAEQDRSVFNSIVVETLLNLFNNIIAPCIATMGVDVRCFYNVFVAPKTVSATYGFTSCGARDYDYNCIQIDTFSFETSYTPPFSYSYQCSSSLVTSYVSVFVFMFIFDTFFSPVLSNCVRTFFKWLKARKVAKQREKDIEAGVAGPLPTELSVNEYKPLEFLKNRFIIKSISNVAILLTFGLMFPPLAIIICYNVWMEYNELHDRITVFYEQELGKRTTPTAGASSPRNKRRYTILKNNLVRFMEEKFTHVSNMTSYLLWLLFPLASVFYAFFIFDMLGDVYGWSTAIGPACAMGAIPIILLYVKEYHRYICLEYEQEAKSQQESEKASRRASIESSSGENKEEEINALNEEDVERKMNHTFSDVELVDIYHENIEIEEHDFMDKQSPRHKRSKSITRQKESMSDAADDCCNQLVTAFFR